MPFFYTQSTMNLNDKKKNKARPYRMKNVSFPPAKYGLYIALAIIFVGSIILLIK